MSIETLEGQSVDDLKLLTACCCEICGIGAFECGEAAKGECLCCEGESAFRFKVPETCVRQKSMCLCCHVRQALPCTDDVPCMIAILGVKLYG